MQIKDLSVEAELAEVRGGIGNVSATISDDSYNKNDSEIEFHGGAVSLSGGIRVGQLLDARKTQTLELPVVEERISVVGIGIDHSSFNAGYFPW